jgi:hydrogenase expression/formation protein HypE
MSSEPFGWCSLPVSARDHVQLGHGSGGKLTAELIEHEIVPAFSNPLLAELDDCAVLEAAGARLAFTTDSYVVTPLFFPGGDIGELAVNGTVNDLAVGGARPLALSLAFILEEGLPIAELRRVIASAKAAAARAGVPIATGDTKVVGRGACDKLFINTSGIGLVSPERRLGSRFIRPGDAILVSGTLGDHGITILTQRHGLALGGGLRSDTAPLHDLCEAALNASLAIHAMRDPTRGGVAATLVEIASRRQLGIELDERALPVSDPVRGACELTGLDPLHVANEGKLVLFIPDHDADRVLTALRSHPLGERAARIGTVVTPHPGAVVLHTAIGGRRLLDLPYGEPLPRIC